MMKFKIGDKVRVKESVSCGDIRGGVEFIYDMEKYIGKIICVEDADWEDNTYLYGGYWFCEEWLEEVEATKILFAKVKPDAIIPTKREEDAGFDIYGLFDEENIVINPHETKMIPTGLATAFDSKYVAILKERGSTGTKGIGQRSGVVDSGYRNEIFVPITNHNDKPLIITKETNQTTLEILAEDYIIYPYSKAICQMILLELPQLQTKEISYEELKNIKSERGMTCLGQSGK